MSLSHVLCLRVVFRLLAVILLGGHFQTDTLTVKAAMECLVQVCA